MANRLWTLIAGGWVERGIMVISNQQRVGQQTAQKSGLGNQWHSVNIILVHWQLYTDGWLFETMSK